MGIYSILDNSSYLGYAIIKDDYLVRLRVTHHTLPSSGIDDFVNNISNSLTKSCIKEKFRSLLRTPLLISLIKNLKKGIFPERVLEFFKHELCFQLDHVKKSNIPKGIVLSFLLDELLKAKQEIENAKTAFISEDELIYALNKISLNEMPFGQSKALLIKELEESIIALGNGNIPNNKFGVFFIEKLDYFLNSNKQDYILEFVFNGLRKSIFEILNGLVCSDIYTDISEVKFFRGNGNGNDFKFEISETDSETSEFLLIVDNCPVSSFNKDIIKKTLFKISAT